MMTLDAHYSALWSDINGSVPAIAFDYSVIVSVENAVLQFVWGASRQNGVSFRALMHSIGTHILNFIRSHFHPYAGDGTETPPP